MVTALGKRYPSLLKLLKMLRSQVQGEECAAREFQEGGHLCPFLGDSVPPLKGSWFISRLAFLGRWCCSRKFERWDSREGKKMGGKIAKGVKEERVAVSWLCLYFLCMSSTVGLFCASHSSYIHHVIESSRPLWASCYFYSHFANKLRLRETPWLSQATRLASDRTGCEPRVRATFSTLSQQTPEVDISAAILQMRELRLREVKCRHPHRLYVEKPGQALQTV